MTPSKHRILRARILAATVYTALCITLVYPQTASATVDVLEANPVTKQLHIFESDDYEGLFWKPVGGEHSYWIQKEAEYLAMGYEFTDSPYVLDWAVLFVIFGAVTACAVLRAIRRHRRR